VVPTVLNHAVIFALWLGWLDVDHVRPLYILVRCQCKYQYSTYRTGCYDRVSAFVEWSARVGH